MTSRSASQSRGTRPSGSAGTATGRGDVIHLAPLTPAHIAAIEARGIDPEMAVRLGVGASEVLGGDAITIPYYDDGKLVGRKHRTLGLDKRFSQDKGSAQIFWNVDCLRDESLASAPLIVTEGEMDALAALQAGYKRVVSVPGGAPNERVKDDGGKKYGFLDHAKALLEGVETIVLAVDTDSNGANLREDLALRLGAARCKFVTYPKGCKDLNDALLAFGEKGVVASIDRSRPMRIHGYYELSELPELPDNKAYPTGIVNLDAHYKLRLGDFTVVTGIPGHGKALAIDTPIPTPNGFVALGKLRIGDSLFDECGKPCRIQAITPTMRDRPCFRVIFRDGAELIADADHQWLTTGEKARRSALMTKKKRGTREGTKPKGTDQRHKRTFASVVTTREIAGSLMSQGKFNHHVALCGAVERLERRLPVDPWLLGAWLGDGTSSAGAITSADEEVIRRIEAMGYTVRKRSAPYGYGILKLQVQLKALGVLKNKHIPEAYRLASIEQRKELLRGLMDTDGTCMKDRTCEFTSVNERLAKQVFDLTLGLGLRATMLVGRATIAGRDISAKYRVRFVADWPVFSLERKVDRQRLFEPLRLPPSRVIVACEPVASVPVRCLQVDSPSRLFLAGAHYIPTHNSSLINEICCTMAKKHGWRTVFASFEQQPQSDHRRALRTFFHGKLEVFMGEEERAEADAWIGQQFGFILPGEDDEVTLTWLLETAAQAILRKEAQILVVDPWNEMDHLRPPDMSQTDYVGFAIKQFKRLAKKYRVHVIVAAHPAKLGRLKDGKYPVPSLYDIADSSHWSNKPEVGIVVHRDDITKTETHIRIVKVRYSEIGKPGEVVGLYDVGRSRYTIAEPEALL